MHLKERHIINSLKKRAKIFPVLGILGVRQVGKSTFLLEQWQELQKAHYITFDKKEIMQRAINSPEHLLLGESDNQAVHLIIDEAQKVPHIFDSIKAIVDQDRRSGAFTLSGSTDFSGIIGIRESLADPMLVHWLHGIAWLIQMRLSVHWLVPLLCIALSHLNNLTGMCVKLLALSVSPKTRDWHVFSKKFFYGSLRKCYHELSINLGVDYEFRI